MKRKRKLRNSNSVVDQELDPMSSLNRHFMCGCGTKFKYKSQLIKHIKHCDGKPLVCHWCNLEFKNRGNLKVHMYYHGDKSTMTNVIARNKNGICYDCNVCDSKFSEPLRLKYHIRRHHFNLRANTPHCESKQVNQTWFEKVLNTNLVMEIKKTGVNTLVMKPIPPAPHIITLGTKLIDLTPLYPIGRCFKEEPCKICNKLYQKNDIKKHMDEVHLNNFKMKCNKCNKMFKRLYQYLKHVCDREKKRRRTSKVISPFLRQYRSIQISNVTSIKTVEVE